MRLTKTERAAAAIVAATAAGVAAAGIRLLRKHTRYTLQKAAAFFAKEEEGPIIVEPVYMEEKADPVADVDAVSEEEKTVPVENADTVTEETETPATAMNEEGEEA
ncbi:MAG: hypothetical protein Q4B59_02545 [Lachnospiraceae bacterium]|nr:hypothetical protein [Lachnospiraceae bacterium]